MGNTVKLCFVDNYDHSLAPVPAKKMRQWWEDNSRTANHAKHCLPLSMANSLGWYILSPGTFLVSWNGDVQQNAVITAIDKSSHYEVDAHAAFGSFTVQAKFIPVTEDPGDFIYIKGIANERCCPYSCMEAAIEAWWNVGVFGIVFLLNQPGEFLINKGQPIAQMFMMSGAAASADLTTQNGYPDEHFGWQAKRGRPEYRKDLDYMRGYTFDGKRIDSHITSWADAHIFRK